jgi:hypothetical protein
MVASSAKTSRPRRPDAAAGPSVRTCARNASMSDRGDAVAGLLPAAGGGSDDLPAMLRCPSCGQGAIPKRGNRFRKRSRRITA